MLKKVTDRFSTVIFGIELFLAGLIVIWAIFNSLNLLSSLRTAYALSGQEAYTLLQSFLSNVLLLVVGLEIALTLIKHSSVNVIDVLIFGVARKLLIYTSAVYDLFLGTLAIAVLFLIKKYLYPAAAPRTPAALAAEEMPSVLPAD